MSKKSRRKKIDTDSLNFAYYRYENDPVFKVMCDKFYKIIVETEGVNDTDIADIAIFVLDKCLDEAIEKKKGENH